MRLIYLSPENGSSKSVAILISPRFWQNLTDHPYSEFGMIESLLVNIFLLINILAVVGGILCVLNGPYLLTGGRETHQWPSALAKITRSEFGPRHSLGPLGTCRKIHLMYEYQVQGNLHRSSELFFGSYWLLGYHNEETAQSIMDNYPLGQQVTVRYNGHKPEEAVLETITCWPLVWGFLLVGGISTSLGVWAILNLLPA